MTDKPLLAFAFPRVPGIGANFPSLPFLHTPSLSPPSPRLLQHPLVAIQIHHHHYLTTDSSIARLAPRSPCFDYPTLALSIRTRHLPDSPPICAERRILRLPRFWRLLLVRRPSRRLQTPTTATPPTPKSSWRGFKDSSSPTLAPCSDRCGSFAEGT